MKFFKKIIKTSSGSLAMLLWVLVLSSCESMNLPSFPSKKASGAETAAAAEKAPIYVVMAERAPFYLENAPKGKRASKGYPFLYLTKGALVKVLKNQVPYSDVLLTNGMKGWMPISDLAPQMAPADGPASSVVPVSDGSGTTGGEATPLPSRLNPENGVKLPTY